jgi:S-adenosyl methyltransferase
VVRFLVGEAGIRQIIDIGTGILTDAEDPAGEPVRVPSRTPAGGMMPGTGPRARSS